MMKNINEIKLALSRFRENELIFASRVYKDCLVNHVNEATYYKTIERMCKNGQLTKISKGVYCYPKITRYGIILPSEQQIVETFTQNNQGLVIGYVMYNHFHLTTQIPKTITVLSSLIDGESKNIRNVNIKRLDLNLTHAIKEMICCLEVLQNFYRIQDINLLAFLEYSKKIAMFYRDDIFEKVNASIHYKKSTIAFLKEILDYYHVSHHLNSYLSSLSSYKYPKIEELYEIAQIQ